jgi:hypothetical protein
MTTYDDGVGLRYDYARMCYEAWRTYHPRVPILVSDDGSANYDSLSAWVSHGISGPHNGIGASLNRALRVVKDDWIYTTDDWLLLDSLELDGPIQLLQSYDIVRIGPVHPNLRCITRFQEGIGWWLEIDLDSEGYPFGTRPFLARHDVIPRILPLIEGTDSYEFEVWFNQRCKEQNFKLAATTLHGPWEHIGDYEVGDRAIR